MYADSFIGMSFLFGDLKRTIRRADTWRAPHPPMEKIKSLVKSPTFWGVVVVIVVLTIAYASKIPGLFKKVAGYLPGSDMKTSAAA